MRVGLALVSFTMLCGCTVADYQSSVTEMSNAVKESVETIDKLDTTMTAARNKAWEASLAANNAVITLADNACSSGRPSCSLTINVRQGDKVVEYPYPATTIIPKPKAALQALKAYLASLEEIVAADTPSKVKGSASSALGSLQDLETTINKARGIDDAKSLVSQYREPTLAAIEWLVGQYVDRVRHKALQEATSNAQPIIDKLNDLFQTTADAALTYEVGVATAAFRKATEQFDKDPTSVREIRAFVDAAHAYDLVLKAAGAKPLEAFALAHRKLRDELNGELDLKDVVASIKDLVRRTKEFKAIVDQYVEATDVKN